MAFLDYTGNEWAKQTRSPTTLLVPRMMADMEANGVVKFGWDVALTKNLVTDTQTPFYKKSVSMFTSADQTLHPEMGWEGNP